MNATPKQSDVQILAAQLGGDNADAVANFVDGRLAAAIDGLREEIHLLVVRQKANVEEAKADGSAEAKSSANGSTKAVKAADEAVKAASESGKPDDAAKAAAKVEEAEKSVAKTESDLAARVSAVEKIIAPWREGETLGSRPASRFDPIEQDLVGLRAEVDQVSSASAHALAVARSGGGFGASLWLIGIVTFGVAFVILTVVAWFTTLTVFWDAIVWSSITTIFVVVCTAILDAVGDHRDEEAWAAAEAEAEVRQHDLAH